MNTHMAELARIDAQVAEQVMGWHQETRSGYPWWHTADGNSIEHVDNWDPTLSMECAWMVVEHLKASREHWVYSLWEDTEDDTLHHARFSRLIPEQWEQVEAEGDSPMLAICRAALAAVKSLAD